MLTTGQRMYTDDYVLCFCWQQRTLIGQSINHSINQSTDGSASGRRIFMLDLFAPLYHSLIVCILAYIILYYV